MIPDINFVSFSVWPVGHVHFSVEVHLQLMQSAIVVVICILITTLIMAPMLFLGVAIVFVIMAFALQSNSSY